MSSSDQVAVDAEEEAVLSAPSAGGVTSGHGGAVDHPHKRPRRAAPAAPVAEDDDDDDTAAGVAPAHRSTANKKALATAAQAQLAAVRKEQAKAQKSRLKFLLGQSEIFAHFIHNLDGPLAPVTPAAAFPSPKATADGVGAEIGEALLLSPIRAAAAAQHKEDSSSPKQSAFGLTDADTPARSVRRTRSAASSAGPVATEAKSKKRPRAEKGGFVILIISSDSTRAIQHP